MKIPIFLVMLIVIVFLGCDSKSTHKKNPLTICVTTTDLEDITNNIGGEYVTVYCFGKGAEDPHVVEIKPNFVKQLSQADILIDVGIGMAGGWLPDLLKSAQRPDMFPGKEKHLSVADVVRHLHNPEKYAFTDSLHADGNPHFLLDPIEGIKTAKLISEKLSQLLPLQKDFFNKNYQTFRQKIATLLVGEQLAQKYSVEKLAVMYSENKLEQFLVKNGDKEKLTGWFKKLHSLRDRSFVGDHDLWPYMARTYGLAILGYLEPKPGVPPTTKHLKKLIEKMQNNNVKILLTCPYFDKRHVKFVAEKSGAIVVNMAHQVKALDGTNSYIEMLQYNFQQLFQGLTK
ncbi:metal ABC transporter substrate-binding protein [Candidatus Uabimicrobium sp. HlEnr_7]|uniref:metal ABC transporter substrate-binding protein n=1 Tax=Candidatus Uabimicrobium helgolandensis TaxID=3095367 RepID=UPI00355746BD